jgi:hypothetical protein
MGERRGAYKAIVGKRGRHRRRKDNIKMNLREVGWEAYPVLNWLRIGTGSRLL